MLSSLHPRGRGTATNPHNRFAPNRSVAKDDGWYQEVPVTQGTTVMFWTKKVGQNQEWDHKPKLKKLLNGTFWHKQGKYMYFYDIWSNIHYGYVGIIGGLSESLLLDGAGAEQIVSDFGRKAEEVLEKPKADWKLPGPHPTASPWTELRSWDDVADRVSISIGVKLASLHPNGGITAKMVMDEVLAVAPENWGAGIDDHTCE